jgi:rSAM/selenodomain-associated transferase 2
MISIIIPTFNEEAHIKTTIQRLINYDRAKLILEVIVADGGSSDETVNFARAEGAKVIICPKKGRSAQMNAGASNASGEILYFLHADTIPPDQFTEDIVEAVAKSFNAGCYRLAFDRKHWFLKANCWFTRFDLSYFRFGDQSLFVTNEIFKETEGFCEKHIVMEDQEIIRRIRKTASFTIIPKTVITSARKYAENGIYKTQAIFFLIFFMYKLGYSQLKLVNTYRRLIRQDKL